MTREDPRFTFHRFFSKCRVTQPYRQNTASIEVLAVQLKCQLLVKTNILIFFGRLGIGEPEHLRMRGRNV